MPILLLILTAAQFLTSRLHEITGLGRSVGDMATDAPSFATPAPYAFFIWILIFALQSATAARLLRPANRTILWPRLRGPLFAMVIASNLWMLTAILTGNGPALLVLIIAMAAATITALFRTIATLQTGTPATRFITHLLLPTLAITAGWLTLATFLNLAGVTYLMTGLPTITPLGAIATLLAASITGLAILLLLRRHPTAHQPYGLTLIWGLLATVIANTTTAHSAIGAANPLVALTALLCAALVLSSIAIKTR